MDVFRVSPRHARILYVELSDLLPIRKIEFWFFYALLPGGALQRMFGAFSDFCEFFDFFALLFGLTMWMCFVSHLDM